jgi:hypothetical protein
MSLEAPLSRPSGTPFVYQIAISCAATVGATCDGVSVKIPIPDDLNIPGATNPSAWVRSVAPGFQGADLIPTTSTIVGTDWVITFLRPMVAGEGLTFPFSLTPPNGTTPDGTQWTLSATASGSNVTTVPSAPTAPATVTTVAVCQAITLTPPAAQVGSTRTYTVRFRYTGTGAGQLFPGPSATEQGFSTFQVPTGFTFVSATGPYVYDSGTRLVTWTPSQNADRTVTLVAPSTPGNYPVETTAQFTRIGEPSQESCQNTVNLSVLDTTVITGTIFTKTARGVTSAGLSAVAAGASSGTGNFTQTIKEFPQAMTIGTNTVIPLYSITLNRNVVTLEGIHVFDALPCLSLGDGLSPATAYDSPAEGDPVCAAPAFHVTRIALPAPPMDDQVVTVTYTDGSSEVIPNTPAVWVAPTTGPMVASVTIDGDYDSGDPLATKLYRLWGWPVISLPAGESRYQRNTATVSGNDFATASVFAGMVTIPAETRLFNLPVTSTYGYTSTWSGSQVREPWPNLGNGNGAGRVGAVAADPAFTDQRRWAVMVADDSGIVVTGGGGRIMQPTSTTGGAGNIPWTSVTPNFGGLGATRYLSAGEGAAALTGVGGTLAFGGAAMGPGVYQYDTYAGFTDSDPSDGGASCTTQGGTVVIDDTGIIGDVGVPRMLCKATNFIIVSDPSGGLQVTKRAVNVTQNSGFVAPPNSVPASPGDTVAFRVRVANLGTIALTGLTVYDILPHVGDTGVVASQTGTPRGSTVAPSLSGVTVPTGWQAEYNASFNPCRPEVGVAAACDNTATAPWTAAMSAAGTVKLTAPTLAPNSFVDIMLEFTVPGYGVWNDGVEAWNSVGAAAALNALDLIVEPPSVGFKYASGAIAWKKTNASGTLLAGAVFRLTGPGGIDLTITDNQAPDADPDDGEFLVDTGLGLGNYTITETTAPALYEVTTTPLTATVTTMGQVVDAGTLINQLSTRSNPPGVAVPTLNEALLALLALALAGIAGWGYRRRA